MDLWIAGAAQSWAEAGEMCLYDGWTVWGRDGSVFISQNSMCWGVYIRITEREQDRRK